MRCTLYGVAFPVRKTMYPYELDISIFYVVHNIPARYFWVRHIDIYPRSIVHGYNIVAFFYAQQPDEIWV